MTDRKLCPICGKKKAFSEFYTYFSKERNKTRLSNYCKPCAQAKARIRASKYYRDNKEERLKYSNEYRKLNKDKIKEQSTKYKKRYIEELQDCYVAEQAAKSLKCSIKNVRSNPELLAAYKKNIKLKRKIKSYGKK